MSAEHPEADWASGAFPASFLVEVLEATEDGLIVFDDKGQVRYCNDQLFELFPVSREFVEEEPAESTLHGFKGLCVDSERFQTLVEEEQRRPELETRNEFRLKNGQVIHRVSRPIQVNGEVVGRAVSVRDITDLRQYERQLEQAQSLVEIGSWEWNVIEDEVDWSDELYEIVDVEPEEFAGTYEAFLGRIHPEDRDDAHRTVQMALNRGDSYRTTFRMVRPAGTVRHVETVGKVETSADGTPVLMHGVVRDRTREQALTDRLRHQALYDNLTELPNRQLLRERGKQSLKEARRSGTSVGLLFLDITGFKRVNQTFGHPFGDEILRRVAGRIEESVREMDVAARAGGDEFVVVTPQLDEPDDVLQVARRIQQSMETPFEQEGETVSLDVGIGVAVFPHHANDLEELMQLADTALFGPDRSKRPGIRLFDPELQKDTSRLLQLTEEFQIALQTDQLVLHYQPVFPAEGGPPVGVEALARWNHPERGLLSAGEFIDVAESTGLVASLDQWAAATGLRDKARWSQDRDWKGWMAVNLSMHSLSEPELPDRIARILQETEILDPSQLMLEVTEHAAMRNPDIAERVLRLLEADVGVSIAIDDFGTGYSSLNYLKQFPAHHLKIDKSFIHGIGTHQDDEKVIRGIVSLAHEFGMTVVAEGVETDEQADWLREAGCDHLQGYLLGRPVAKEELALGSEHPSGT